MGETTATIVFMTPLAAWVVFVSVLWVIDRIKKRATSTGPTEAPPPVSRPYTHVQTYDSETAAGVIGDRVVMRVTTKERGEMLRVEMDASDAIFLGKKLRRFADILRKKRSW